MINSSILLLRRQTGNNIIAISIGIVYLWFGLLKVFPIFSLAEEIAKDTNNILFLGMIPSNISITLLAIWETFIELLLLTNNYQRLAITLALLHITLTLIPFIAFPNRSFGKVPSSFKLIGKYITKDIIILSPLKSLLKRSNETYKFSNIN